MVGIEDILNNGIIESSKREEIDQAVENIDTKKLVKIVKQECEKVDIHKVVGLMAIYSQNDEEIQMIKLLRETMPEEIVASMIDINAADALIEVQKVLGRIIAHILLEAYGEE